MIYYVTVSILYVLCKLLFGLKVYGLEYIPRKGAFILASNHASHLDPPLLAVACISRRQLHFLAKKELFGHRLFGRYIAALNAFPIDRDRSSVGAFRECIRRLRKQQALLIFPEGRRTPTGQLLEGLPGIALVARKSGVPTIPAYINGSDRALSTGQKSLRPCPITVRFGAPIFPSQAETQTHQEFTQCVMSAIGNLAFNSRANK